MIAPRLGRTRVPLRAGRVGALELDDKIHLLRVETVLLLGHA